CPRRSAEVRDGYRRSLGDRVWIPANRAKDGYLHHDRLARASDRAEGRPAPTRGARDHPRLTWVKKNPMISGKREIVYLPARATRGGFSFAEVQDGLGGANGQRGGGDRAGQGEAQRPAPRAARAEAQALLLVLARRGCREPPRNRRPCGRLKPSRRLT